MSSTRKFIGLTMVVLAALTLVAMTWRDEVDVGDRTPLSWSTDLNPQRGPQVDAFNAMFPESFLQIDPTNRDKMKVMVQSTANMGPDIIQVGENQFQLYHSAGILLDVTDQAKEMGFGVDTLPPQIRPLVQMKVLKENGKLVNRQFLYPCNVWHGFILYNKNLFDHYGIEYPSEDLTWEEYIDKAKRLTQYVGGGNTPEVFGAVDAGTRYMPTVLLWEMGGGIMNQDGTRCILTQPQSIKALLFYHSLIHKLKVEPTPDAMQSVEGQGGFGNGPINWFGDGKVGMLWGSRWMLIGIRRFQMEQRQIREAWLKDHPGADPSEGPQVLRLGACKVPRFKGGERYTNFGARCAGINRKGKHADQAVNFLKFLSTEAYAQTINQGADSKPGPSIYNKLELMHNPAFPGEEEVNRISIASIPDSRMEPRNPFVDDSVVKTAFANVKNRIINSKNLTEEELTVAVQRAAEEIDLAILRSIQRNKQMRDIYDAMREAGCEPIQYEDRL